LDCYIVTNINNEVVQECNLELKMLNIRFSKLVLKQT